MKTLILNVNYDPLSVVHVKRAIVLMHKPYLQVIEYYDEEMRSERVSFKIPAVMVYSSYINRPFITRPAKKAILIRDNMQCQYCSKRLNSEEHSVDHIIPVSRFPSKHHANTWENMVACCKTCNYKKHNKTPDEAGMKLLSRPKKPRRYLISGSIPRQWGNYL